MISGGSVVSLTSVSWPSVALFKVYTVGIAIPLDLAPGLLIPWRFAARSERNGLERSSYRGVLTATSQGAEPRLLMWSESRSHQDDVSAVVAVHFSLDGAVIVCNQDDKVSILP